jgi:predicted methyltransferase
MKLPLLLAGAAALFAACAQTPSSTTPLDSAGATRLLAATDRTPADRTNDLRRQPQSMLPFIGIRPGITALDVSAAGGYTTELLARAIGPQGTVYGQSRRRPAQAQQPAAPEGNSHPNVPPAPVAASAAPPPRTSAQALAERAERLQAAGVPAARIVPVERPFEDPAPPEAADGGLDLVTLMFNYHDLGHLGVDRQRMNQALFKALKRGGLYVIADHAGRPGTGISEAGTLHRIEEAFLRREVEAAGFRLIDEGTFLRNPADPRDRNTPEPPQPKDEFVLKFVKP